MSAQFRHEEYAERLEAIMTGEGGQQLVRRRDKNSVKECMEKKLEGKDKGRFEISSKC
jgi:hypothetical protein